MEDPQDPQALVGHRYGCEFTVTAIGPPLARTDDDRVAMLWLRGGFYAISVGELRTLIASGLLERRT